MNVLRLRTETTELEFGDSRWIKIRKYVPPKVTFADFYIDGKSLRDSLSVAYAPAPVSLLSTGLVSDFIQSSQEEYVHKLLGVDKPDFASGRTAVLVCAHDGDYVCGVLACRIAIDEGVVTWSDFAWEAEDIYEEGDDMSFKDTEDGDDTAVPQLGPFTFDKAKYQAVLNDYIDRLKK